MRIVLDTNILVAASRSRRGSAFHLLQLIPDDRFDICLSMPLYLEYLDVLTRPEQKRHQLSEAQVTGAVRFLVSQAVLQDIYFHWRPFLSDAKDDMLLELAVASQSNHIVTFNLKDFRGCEQFGIKAIKPQDFLLHIGEFS